MSSNLEVVAEDLIRNSLAPSTQRAYGAAQAQYCNFCRLINAKPIPASEQLLVLFAAYMAQKCCYSTIRVYLSAVRHLHISNGYGDPLAGALQLNLTLRGVKRKKPQTGDARLPITPLILQKILEVVRRDPQNYTNLMMWAACCLGYFAFLRCGEFTVNGKFDSTVHLSDQDIAVDDYNSPTILSILLRQSKTDQDKVGITLFVGRTGQDICPLSSMIPYLVSRREKFPRGALFVTERGLPLSRLVLVAWLKTALSSVGIDATHFTGHSFRIGAASTASARGIADSTIQTLGRWKSDSFKRYIRMPRQELAELSSTLAQ